MVNSQRCKSLDTTDVDDPSLSRVLLEPRRGDR
jgi:hypothetical protein